MTMNEPDAIRPDKRPDILAYMDYRSFIRDQLDYLQSCDRKFSQRWVAKRAGFKAPQLLSMIVQGHRNLTKEKIPELAAAFKLTPREIEYFQIIVALSQCDGHQEQKALLDKIQTVFKNGLFSAIDEAGAEIFRDWYYPAIREIVTLADCDHTPKWMAERLGIKVEDAEAAVETLLRLGFLRRGADGKLERSEPSVGTANEKTYPMLLNAWHLKMLERGFNAMPLASADRHFEGLTVSVPKTLMPRLRESIERFFRELDVFVESQDVRDEVYHLQLALFPLTKLNSQGQRAGASKGRSR